MRARAPRAGRWRGRRKGAGGLPPHPSSSSSSPHTLPLPQQEKDATALADLGGPGGLALALGSSLTNGVGDGVAHGVPLSTADLEADVAARRAAFGPNTFKTAKSKSFFRLFFENLKDPTLILLMGAALVSCF